MIIAFKWFSYYDEHFLLYFLSCLTHFVLGFCICCFYCYTHLSSSELKLIKIKEGHFGTMGGNCTQARTHNVHSKLLVSFWWFICPKTSKQNNITSKSCFLYAFLALVKKPICPICSLMTLFSRCHLTDCHYEMLIIAALSEDFCVHAYLQLRVYGSSNLIGCRIPRVVYTPLRSVCFHLTSLKRTSCKQRTLWGIMLVQSRRVTLWRSFK